MINNELQTVAVVSYTTALDAYGQTRTVVASTYNTQMFIKKYSNQNVNNPKFNDYQLIALTKDNIDCSKSLQFDNKKFDIKYIIPSKRWNQLFLVEVK